MHRRHHRDLRGMVWIPANSKMEKVGLSDSRDAACAYLERTVGKISPILQAFLDHGDRAIGYLRTRRRSDLNRSCIIRTIIPISSAQTRLAARGSQSIRRSSARPAFRTAASAVARVYIILRHDARPGGHSAFPQGGAIAAFGGTRSRIARAPHLATAGPSARRIARSRQRPRRPSSSIPTAIRRVDQRDTEVSALWFQGRSLPWCDSRNATGYVRNPGETRSRACDRWPR